VIARGTRGHSGTASGKADLTERLLGARADITEILRRCLTLEGADGWVSQVRFPFIQVGMPGVYNVTADRGLLGVEVRPIPQDDLHALRAELKAYCASNELELDVSVMENGIACDPDNPYLLALIQAMEAASGSKAIIRRKLPGTSAPLPRGQGIVWGQSGLGPHARDERHFIPSIAPYYRALTELADRLIGNQQT
jgi:acetylornithine deacetylase/succinyl-diaminopimelate desuccinylase-like protein